MNQAQPASMRKPKTTLVLTTINNPLLLEGYADNFAHFGQLEHVDAIGRKAAAPATPSKEPYDLATINRCAAYAG
jgi:hypothetical protein